MSNVPKTCYTVGKKFSSALNKKKCADLKEILRVFKCKVSGNKKDLINRIVDYFNRLVESYTSGVETEENVKKAFELVELGDGNQPKESTNQDTVVSSKRKRNTDPETLEPVAKRVKVTNKETKETLAKQFLMVPNSNIRLDISEDPFYELVDEPPLLQFPLPVTTNIAGKGRMAYAVACQTLTLTATRFMQIKQQWRIHLRAFIHKKGNSNAPPPGHNWPSDCCLKVNGNFVELQKQDDKKLVVAMPADITSNCNIGANSIEIYATSLIPFHVVIQLTRKLPVEELLKKIKENSISYQDALEQVKYSFQAQNTDVALVHTKLTILDPLKLSRILLPGRASSCKHIECFDLENYLLMNERIRRWMCPVCNRPALFKDLQYDCYFAKILETLQSDPTAIGVEIKPDGEWIIEVPNNSTDNISQSDDSPMSKIPLQKSLSHLGKKGCQVVTIELESDDDNTTREEKAHCTNDEDDNTATTTSSASPSGLPDYSVLENFFVRVEEPHGFIVSNGYQLGATPGVMEGISVGHSVQNAIVLSDSDDE